MLSIGYGIVSSRVAGGTLCSALFPPTCHGLHGMAQIFLKNPWPKICELCRVLPGSNLSYLRTNAVYRLWDCVVPRGGRDTLFCSVSSHLPRPSRNGTDLFEKSVAENMRTLPGA